MTLDDLVKTASRKENFTQIKHWVEFCQEFLLNLPARATL